MYFLPALPGATDLDIRLQRPGFAVAMLVEVPIIPSTISSYLFVLSCWMSSAIHCHYINEVWSLVLHVCTWSRGVRQLNKRGGARRGCFTSRGILDQGYNQCVGIQKQMFATSHQLVTHHCHHDIQPPDKSRVPNSQLVPAYCSSVPERTAAGTVFVCWKSEVPLVLVEGRRQC